MRDAVDTAAWAPDADLYSPGALSALDSAFDRAPREDDLLDQILDQVAAATPAPVTDNIPAPIAEDDIFAAGWSAMVQKPDAAAGVQKLT